MLERQVEMRNEPAAARHEIDEGPSAIHRL